jgi:hypothetical protein
MHIFFALWKSEPVKHNSSDEKSFRTRPSVDAVVLLPDDLGLVGPCGSPCRIWRRFTEN